MRHAVFSRLDLDPGLARAFNPGVTWNGWQVPVQLEVLMVVTMGLVLLVVAIFEFRGGD
jgi:ABC-2 type transport system permease protein